MRPFQKLFHFSPRRFQQLLLLTTAGASLYFSICFSSSFIHYLSLQGQSKGQVHRWEVVELKEDRFGIKADYSFPVSNKNWKGSCLLKNIFYLNEFAAISGLREIAKQEWIVWFDPDCPETSSLEKSFPWGLLARALICYSLLLYFGFFNSKIKKYHLSDEQPQHFHN